MFYAKHSIRGHSPFSEFFCLFIFSFQSKKDVQTEKRPCADGNGGEGCLAANVEANISRDQEK